MSGTVRLYIDGKLVAEKRYHYPGQRKRITDYWKKLYKEYTIGIEPDIPQLTEHYKDVFYRPEYSNSGHLKTIEKYG